MAAVWGWVIVSCFTMCVGLSMAEIVSSVPSAGGECPKNSAIQLLLCTICKRASTGLLQKWPAAF